MKGVTRVGRPAAMSGARLDVLDVLDALNDSRVRDLAWLLFSPDLLHAQPPSGMLACLFESTSEADATVGWLRALDRNAGALHRYIEAAHVTRLGLYAECLLAWFLRHGPAGRLVAANVALRRAGVTLGECDFLVETAQGRRLHWELAVKCYLHAGEGRARLSDYVGPNLQDRLDLKLAHLLDHQLPMSAREELALLGHRGRWDAQMLVKGWLFYRHGDASPEPPQIDPAHARGWWTTRGEWPGFATEHAERWKVLPRLDWLAPQRQAPSQATATAVLVDADGLIAQLAHQQSPTMVAAFSRDEAGRQMEQSRGFIVPDDWPLRARAFARQ